MRKVLHITAHLGGGVGGVLSAVALNAKQNGSVFRHEIMQLEPTNNRHYVEICEKNGIPLMLADKTDIKNKISSADIVQIDWWPHPLTMKFMHDNLSAVPSRLVIWSHVSGCKYPYIPAGFIKLPRKFIFTSPFSYENPYWDEETKDKIREISEVVISSSGNYAGKKCGIKSGSEFVIGYVGYLGYRKTNPDFIKFCEAVDIPGVQFTVVGDVSHGQDLIRDAEKSGLRERFVFTGYVNNVEKQLANFDAFGYLLNPEHTGTAENALLEAMAAGIPPVVLNQNALKHIVRDGYTGFVVNDTGEYGKAMRYLFENPLERIRIGENASQFVRENFCISNTLSGLEKVYNKVLAADKRVYDVKGVFGDTPYEWFKMCLGDEKDNASNLEFILGPSKCSIYQYIKYFSEDKALEKFLSSVLPVNEEVY